MANHKNTYRICIIVHTHIIYIYFHTHKQTHKKTGKQPYNNLASPFNWSSTVEIVSFMHLYQQTNKDTEILLSPPHSIHPEGQRHILYTLMAWGVFILRSRAGFIRTCSLGNRAGTWGCCLGWSRVTCGWKNLIMVSLNLKREMLNKECKQSIKSRMAQPLCVTQTRSGRSLLEVISK